MASIPQMSTTLGASNKIMINNTQPCIAQLHHNKKHFSNKHSLFPLALVKQNKKPIELLLMKHYQNEKWKTRNGVDPEFMSRQKDVIEKFYLAFNHRDIETLSHLVSPHCVFQDFLFYTPLHGIESLVKFWKNVMDAMGPNIHIIVDKVNVDDHLMATVFWHLAWRDKKIPFTNGCRFFTFQAANNGELQISEITGLEEFPIKPGELVLKVLKTVSTLLDNYDPLAAALLLESEALQDIEGDIRMGLHDKH